MPKMLLLLIAGAWAILPVQANAGAGGAITVEQYVGLYQDSASEGASNPDRAFIAGLDAGIFLSVVALSLPIAVRENPPFCIPSLDEDVMAALFRSYLARKIAEDRTTRERLVASALLGFLVETFPCKDS